MVPVICRRCEEWRRISRTPGQNHGREIFFAGTIKGVLSTASRVTQDIMSNSLKLEEDMQQHPCLVKLVVVLALLMFSAELVPAAGRADTVASTATTETIVLIRHGEKPTGGLGQLTIKGLNRSLALPDILIGKYGKPDYIFAPSPSVLVDGGRYSYVRPLATIEPTAIKLGMPVDTQIGFDNIQQLQSELTKPVYATSMIFVAWEHGYLDGFAKNLVKTYGGDPTIVPSWPDSDYDTIFVIRLTATAAATTETFSIDHEGLDGKLSSQMPVPGGD